MATKKKYKVVCGGYAKKVLCNDDFQKAKKIVSDACISIKGKQFFIECGTYNVEADAKKVQSALKAAKISTVSVE